MNNDKPTINRVYPNINAVYLIFVFAVLWSLAGIYEGFLAEYPLVYPLVFTQPEVVLPGFFIIMSGPWVWFYFINKNYYNKMFLFIDHCKSSDLISDTIKNNMIELENLLHEEILNKEEYVKKIKPYCKEAWGILSIIKDEKDQKIREIHEEEKQRKIDKINYAYKEGLLTKHERDEKIKKCNSRFEKKWWEE